MVKKKDHTIENLLILDGDRYFIEDGKYEVVFKVDLIEVSTERPHGLKYSLVLLNANGNRLIGFDNAHPAPKRRGPGAKKNLIMIINIKVKEQPPINLMTHKHL